MTLFICNHFFYGFNQTMISLLDFFNHDFKTMVLWYYCKFRTAIVTLKIPVMGIHYCDFIWGILMGMSYGAFLSVFNELSLAGPGRAGPASAGLGWPWLALAGLGWPWLALAGLG